MLPEGEIKNGENELKKEEGIELLCLHFQINIKQN
jgi:hypothetical protein